MKLEKIRYRDLNGRQQEIYNFQKVAAVLADYGFNCIRLSDDWQGADFLAYHKDQDETLKVQQKSRVGIARKYLKKGLYICFPVHGEWHLVEHDRLVQIAGETTNWLKTKSWREVGVYNAKNPSKAMCQALADYKL